MRRGIDPLEGAMSLLGSPEEASTWVDSSSMAVAEVNTDAEEHNGSLRGYLPKRIPRSLSRSLRRGSTFDSQSEAAVVPHPETEVKKTRTGGGFAWASQIGKSKAVVGHVYNNRETLKQDIIEQHGRSQRSVMSSATCLIGEPFLRPMSFAGRVVSSRRFEILSFFMVVFNAVWIAIDVDHNQAPVITEATWYFQLAENTCCAFFFIEWSLWLAAHGHMWRLLGKGWFLCDTVIVWSMVIETWLIPAVVALLGGSGGSGLDASVFRILRLARLTRMTRIMRMVPELVFMLKGLAQATRTVSCTMVLLLAVVYILGIVMKQLSMGTDMGDEYFSTVPLSMYTCMMAGTLLDEVREVMDAVRKESWVCAVVFSCVIVFSALTMMNMLVGVLCEVIGQVASTEKEEMLVAAVKKELREFLDELDTDIDGHITKEEFAQMLRSPVAIKSLTNLGVDVVALLDSAEFLFQSDEAGQKFDKVLDFDAFMGTLLQLRGQNRATVSDVMELRKFIHAENTRRNCTLVQLEENQRRLAHNQQLIYSKLRSDTCASCTVESSATVE